MELKNWNGLNKTDKELAYEQIRSIFFAASARREFNSIEAREEFFWRWTHPYWKHWPEQVWLLTDKNSPANTNVLGYLMGSLDTQKEVEHFHNHLPSPLTFSEHFADFPAHLHINLAEQARGQGCGSRLIQHFIQKCREKHLAGLHIITNPESRNVGFYRKNGFDSEREATYKNHRLMFMARRLFE